MNLKSLSDSVLLAETDRLVKNERELLTSILHHLKEIERRRLFSSLGLRSLFDYAVKTLGYSEDQAYRRIEAMRALKELPEIEEKLNLGLVSLTNLTLAQKLFRQEKKSAQKEFSRSEKLTVIEKLENKSTREAEKIVLSLSSTPKPFVTDKIRYISEEKVEIKFPADQVLMRKIEKLKGLLAHSNPDIPMNELFHKLCDLGIREWNPAEAPEQKTAAPRKRCTTNSHHKSIARSARREVWKKARGQCEICGSRFALEIDHIHPKVLGGSHDIENLRLLCRSCNQRSAINLLGQEKMSHYLEKPALR